MTQENSKSIAVGGLNFSNELPFVLMGGVNVLESETMALEVAERKWRSHGPTAVHCHSPRNHDV